jgi:hypothetical protein
VAAATPVSAADPSSGQIPQATSGQASPSQWAQLKADLNASSLPRSVTVSGGVRTITYTLASGSKLVLTEPAGGTTGQPSPQFSVGGCGFLRLCVWLNRGDQLVLLAGGVYALTAMICIASLGVACVVVGTALVMGLQYIMNRGYVCPNYEVIELAFSPGTIRGCY